MAAKPLKTEILVAFGGNLPSAVGAPFATIEVAIAAMAEAGVEVTRVSSCYRSPAVTLGPTDVAPEYSNAAMVARTDLTPAALLVLGQKLERQFGRVPAARWSARTLDIDLLAYGAAILPDLAKWRALASSDDPAAILPVPVVPHPRLHGRGFVLAPLMEIAPDWRHPVLGSSVQQLYDTVHKQGGLDSIVKGEALGRNLAL